MERKNVYELIDGERDYQDKIPAHSKKIDENNSISDWIVFIEAKLRKAKDYIYSLAPGMALSEIRKIAALSVACMEYNNTEPRYDDICDLCGGYKGKQCQGH